MKLTYPAYIFTIILSVCMTAPLANDIFVSGMPAMKVYFGLGDMSLVLSMSLLGLAVSQLFYGPLLDRFGRKPVLLAGLILYTAMSALVMTAHVFTVLLWGRFFQAVGVCATITSVMAIARDTYESHELVRATSFIMAIMGIGPALAPLVGSLLNHLWGWRASFVFLFILGCFYTLWIAIFLKESHHPAKKEAMTIHGILYNYLNLIRHVKFLRYCAISGFSYGVLFSYISVSSFFIIEKLHFTLPMFGTIVAINALAIMGMSLLTPKINKHISVSDLVNIGLCLITSGGILMFISAYMFSSTIYTLMMPMFITTLGIGMIRPTASAGAMQLVEKRVAGTAASFFNLFSFVSGTIAIMVTTKLVSSIVGFGFFITIMGGCALLICVVPAIVSLYRLKIVS